MEPSVWKATESTRDVRVERQPSLLTILERLCYQQGEKRLMLAILKDAVGCIERYGTGHGLQSWPACRAALQWVLCQDRTWPFSFENICLALDLDPVRFRSVLCSPLGAAAIKPEPSWQAQTSRRD